VSQDKQPNDYAAAYAGLISQIGCTTSVASIIIIAVAFGAGRLLDNTFGTSGIFTVVFLVGSFPVTLYVILRLALSTAARAQRLSNADQQKDNQEHEEKTDS
jgi:F0F1-type ATP synthase assembly protein I